MFIEASGEVTFTHENPRTGQPVQDQKGQVTIRVDLGDLEKLLKPLIDLVSTGSHPNGIKLNGLTIHDRPQNNGFHERGEPPRS